MCRLFAFAFSDTTEEDTKIQYLNSFRQLSLTGAVLNHSVPGHQDGWGTAVYTEGVVTPSVYKSVQSALADIDFDQQHLFHNKLPQSGVAHLRKKTVGEVSLLNTHPFVDGAYSFAHNGTICDTEQTYGELASGCQGNTDSERLFKKFLEIKKNSNLSTQEAFKIMLLETKRLYPSFSAINTILHDGDSMYVSRVVNVERFNCEYTKDQIENYYTIYLGVTKNGDSFISSEKMNTDEIIHTSLANNTFCIIDRTTGTSICNTLE